MLALPLRIVGASRRGTCVAPDRSVVCKEPSGCRSLSYYNLGTVIWEQVDALGATLFGRALRLRVLLWVRQQQGAFFQGQAARGVEYSGVSAVAQELERLEGLGMLRRFGRPANVGRVNYVRVESPLWEVVDVVAAILEPPTSQVPISGD